MTQTTETRIGTMRYGRAWTVTLPDGRVVSGSFGDALYPTPAEAVADLPKDKLVNVHYHITDASTPV